MMKYCKIFPKQNKKGVTLVELVFGVVVLSIFAIGIIASLSAANTKIAKDAQDASNHTEAVQIMDAMISVISNGDYATSTNFAEDVKRDAGYAGNSDVQLSAVADVRDSRLYGWKLTLTYKGSTGVTVTGYASCTKGAFDKDDEEV